MQVGTLYTKIVTRKLQGSGKGFQFMLLSGFSLPLTHKTAVYYDTLSPNHILTEQEIGDAVAKHKKLGAAQCTRDCTNSDVQKKLEKLLFIGNVEQNFEALGIGHYL
jgi:hypothetical protein